LINASNPAAPNTTLTITRTGNNVKATWTALKTTYTRVQINSCLMEGSTQKECKYHVIKDQTKPEAGFTVEEKMAYIFYLEVFEGSDLVYRSDPVIIPAAVTGTDKPDVSDAGLITGIAFTVTVIVVVSVIVAAAVVIQRRNKACSSGNVFVFIAEGMLSISWLLGLFRDSSQVRFSVKSSIAKMHYCSTFSYCSSMRI
jgi:hypothetical protein